MNVPKQVHPLVECSLKLPDAFSETPEFKENVPEHVSHDFVRAVLPETI